ncbi:MAG: peptidoglycan-binding protein [Propionibacteriaceae bacterium]|nr:peptidoglycan-binding protein [Propionibacteriaceae bacterium]
MTPQRAHTVIRRQRILLIITAVALVACVVGGVAARYVKSPAEQAAEQSPPPESVITATVTSQVLTQHITVRGTVSVSQATEVASLVQASPAIVTRLSVRAGDPVAEGQILAEVSGRPLFAMAGAVPAYRSLMPGDKGADVEQLQRAMQRLGFLSAATWGTYDQATKTAVSSLFKQAGYPAPDGMELGTVVFVPTLPARVGAVAVHVGDHVDSTPLMTVLSGPPLVTATIPAGQLSGIEAGQAVAISDEANRRTGAGTVDSVGEFTAQQVDANGVPVSGSVPGYPVVVSVLDGVDATWVGASVALTITMACTTDAVLTVPLAAVQSDEDGGWYVAVLDSAGRRTVPLTTGLVADGYVEVRPVTVASLQAGDEVVVSG